MRYLKGRHDESDMGMVARRTLNDVLIAYEEWSEKGSKADSNVTGRQRTQMGPAWTSESHLRFRNENEIMEEFSFRTVAGLSKTSMDVE